MITRNTRASKRWMVAATAALVCGSTLAISGSASALPGAPTPDRISGANRYETAVEVAMEFGAPCNFVIASGTDFPDGLTAASYSDPILLTEAAALPAATKGYLDALTGTAIAPGPCGFGGVNTVVVGGTAVVSSAQKEILDGYGVAVRVSGANRYETAIAVATSVGVGTDVTIATGLNFPDALAGGVLAQAAGAPILLNDGDVIRADVKKFLLDNGITDAYILGGTAAVPASVATELTSALGIAVTRLSGSDRAATAVAIANEIDPTGPQGSLTVVDVNGFGFADALSAAPYAWAIGNAPILLTGTDAIPAATAAYHKTFCDPIDNIDVVGGTSAVSNTVVAGAVAAATCTGDVISKATLVNSDFKQGSFEIDPAGDLTVTADVGTAAQGSGVNAWSIEYIQSGVVADAGVKILTQDTDCIPGCGAPLPRFQATNNFTGLAYNSFVTFWNASPAAALTTAANGDVTNPTFGGVPALQGITNPGSQDSAVTVTFDQAVTAAAPSGVALNLTGAPLILGVPDATSTITPVTGSTVVTFTWNDSNLVPAPAVPGFNQILFPVNGITFAGGVMNTIAAAEQLVAP